MSYKNYQDKLKNNREYRANHPQKVKEWNQRFRERNREKLRLKAKKRYGLNPKLQKLRNKKYREHIPEKVKMKILLGMKKWREKNKEKIWEYKKEYYRKHHQEILVYNRNKKALRRNAEGSFTLREWENKKKESNFTCLMCGGKEPKIKLTIDHIIPLSKNGTNYIDNIQPLCKRCNSIKWASILKL